MSKLLDHFEAMQEAARHYLEPGDSYVDRDAVIHKGVDRHYGFANDMVYMLDGPEQREAEEDAASEAKELQQAPEWRLDIRKQVEQADTATKLWKGRHDELAKEIVQLRADLHSAQMQVSERNGQLLMLEQLGTIPKQQSLTGYQEPIWRR